MAVPITKEVAGGLGAVPGLQVSGISAGFRRNPERRDLALVVAPDGATAAGVFTQSGFAAAPVTVSRQHLAWQAHSTGQQNQTEARGCKALIINSGNANAATGAEGVALAKAVSELTAEALGCKTEQVLVASTGVIGAKLSLDSFETGIPEAIAALSTGQNTESSESINAGCAVAEAIMTTDTKPKTAARTFMLVQEDGSEVPCTIGGMAKGSGMIAPNMATMIAVMATDAPVKQRTLQQALNQAVNVSFNKVTIDSDTSTNDSAYLIATGASAGELLTTEHPAYPVFVEVLTEVCQDLTYQIASDGEGATKVIVVDVTGAATEQDAEKATRAIADSPLVKTAVAGHDANWGRIAMAIGKSGATFEQEQVSISIMGLEVFLKGKPVEFSEAEALTRFSERDEVLIVVDLGAGDKSDRVWTCDLTHGYIEINGDYRT